MNKKNKEILIAVEKILDDNNIKYSISNIDKKNFTDNKMHIYEKRKLLISHSEVNNPEKLCSLINRKIVPSGYHVTKDNYNTLYLSSINESTENLYHISTHKNLTELRPSIPINFLTKSGYEENKTPRICFTNSISKCLTALSENCKDKEYYVYIPDGDYEVYTPSTSEVPDRNITGEVWIKETVKVKCIGKILCTDSYGNALQYKYGNKTAELYKWKYKNISLDESAIYENNNEELELPDNYNNEGNDDLITLLNNINHKNIYLSSDWHLFQTHYKNEKNYVNTQKIISWCRQNIKDNDIFMYLGDICFRYCNKEDQEKTAKIFNSLPGIKVLIAGNHDLMLGDEFINSCGFKYVFTEYNWNNLIFSHRPIRMEEQPSDWWNIHGHIHKWSGYNTTDGKRNINVYPYFYDNKPVTLDYLLKHKEELVKNNYWNNNAMLSETKRSELDDSQFGIPEDRKYPLDTKQHVSSAIKLFGHAEETKKKKLAKNIAAAAKKYDLSIPETTQCYKYLQEGKTKNIFPFNIKNNFINTNTNIDEWGISSYNPVIGIVKPFVLKVSNDTGSIINTKQFLFSPDIISDKYLVINEDAKLEIVDADKYNNYYVEIYEYIGNKSRLNKLNEIYKSGKIVDNTIFYTILTGKPMLCDDQIDFDPNFKKIDINLIKENIISEMATLRDEFLKVNNINTSSILVNENYINKPEYLYNYSNIIIKEDLNGYYLYNTLTNKRSGSEKHINKLSESMIKSII